MTRYGRARAVPGPAQQQYIGRSCEQMARFFAGTDLVGPGLVRVEEWRPDPDPGETGRSTL